MSAAEAHSVSVFQDGAGHRYTARCACGWEETTGAMRATQTAAKEHLANPAGRSQALAVAKQPESQSLALWSGEQVELLRRHVAPGCTDAELAFFAEVCRHRDLDPFALEIVAVRRKQKNKQTGGYDENMTIQTTVRGERTLAERTGLYGGQDAPEWCGPDMLWHDVWLAKEPPAAARVRVYRKDWDRPAVGIARWSSYVQLNRAGEPMNLWATAPELMLAKCAEAAALRKAFARGRDLTDAQRVAMEARQVGLDDNARHQLVERVTDGRTNSTRELTDDEILEARVELARISAEIGADPQTGEVIDVESDPDPAPLADEPKPDAVARTIARAAADLETRLERLTTWQADELKDWRRAQGLARPVGTFDAAERVRLAAELDRRSWATTSDAAGAPEVAEHDDVAELDQYSDEPF